MTSVKVVSGSAEMNARGTILVLLIISSGLQIAISGKGEVDQRSNVRENRAFDDRAFRNIIREAGDFLGNLTAAKKASAAADAKLEELRSALTQKSSKSSSAILLPSGWDKKSILDAVTRALSQNKQLRDLSDKADRFMAEIKKLEETAQNTQISDKASEINRSKNNTSVPSFPVPRNLTFGNLNALDNSSLMGKLVGFIKTGRQLSSFQLSDLNPCTKGSCDKWKKGLESLRDFISRSTSRLGNFFKNSATLRILSEEEASPIRTDSKKVKVANKTKRINSTAVKAEITKKPIDYFDYYYNGEETPSQKQASTVRPNHTASKSSTPSKNASIPAGKNVLAGARKVADYFDYYYGQGIPVLISNRSQFIGGKLGG